jgi:hypothetical protein
MKNCMPDVKGPRFRKTTKKTVVKEMVDHIQSEVFAAKYLTEKQIKNIILEFNNEVWNTVIEKRDGVEIPSQLGHLFIGSCPRKKSKNVDFKTSADHGKVIQHKNYESDDYLAKIFFTTFASRYKFKNNELWGFTGVREFKRTVAKEYPKKWNSYIQVDPRMKISSLYRSRLYNIERNEDAKESLKTYNEFEF